MSGDGEVNDRTKRTPKLTPADRRTLCRELAEGGARRAALARKYGVDRSYVTLFAQRYRREIADLRERLEDEFAGMWIASKEARLAAYQADYEASLNGEYADHFEQIRTRMQILRNVAEELGQLPNRSTAVVIVPVRHVIEGADLEALK